MYMYTYRRSGFNYKLKCELRGFEGLAIIGFAGISSRNEKNVDHRMFTIMFSGSISHVDNDSEA